MLGIELLVMRFTCFISYIHISVFFIKEILIKMLMHVAKVSYVPYLSFLCLDLCCSSL